MIVVKLYRLIRKICTCLVLAMLTIAYAGCGEEGSAANTSSVSTKKPDNEDSGEESTPPVDSSEVKRDGSALIQLYEDAVNLYGTVDNANYNGIDYLDSGSGVVAPFLCEVNGGYALVILRQEKADFPVLMQEIYVEKPANTWKMISQEQVLIAGSNGANYRVVSGHEDGNISMVSFRNAGAADNNVFYQLGGNQVNKSETTGQNPESEAFVDGSNGLFIADFTVKKARENFYKAVKGYEKSEPMAGSQMAITENTGSCKENAEKAGMIYVAQNYNTYYNSDEWGDYTSQVGSGCNVACITMVASSLGYKYTPGELIKMNGGSVFWNDGTYKKMGIKVAYRLSAASYGGEDQVAAAEFLNECLERFQENPGEISPPRISIQFTSSSNHYLLIIGKMDDGNYICVDPNLDKRATFRLGDYKYSQDATGYTSYIIGVSQYMRDV